MYATRADIIELYGREFLESLLPDDPGADFEEETTVASALKSASAEMDAHLSARYALPLAGVPEALKRPAVDIANYIMANSHSRMSDEIEKRYEQAIRLMERIASGKAGLGADEPRIEVGGASSQSGSFFSSNKKVMGRGNL